MSNNPTQRESGEREREREVEEVCESTQDTPVLLRMGVFVVSRNIVVTQGFAWETSFLSL